MECIVRQIREEVLWFATKMEDKLKENDHKSGWDMMDLPSLLERAVQEFEELRITIEAAGGMDGPVDEEAVKTIIDETADVANFMMMMADNLNNDIF